jgi:hypothetical protein
MATVKPVTGGAETQIGRALSRPDPQLSFRWIVKAIPDKFGFATKFKIDSAYVESFELPFSNIKSDGVFFGGGYDYFPGFHDTSAFNVTFYGDSEHRVLKYIWAWKNTVKNIDTGLYKVGDKFKDEWVVQLLNNTGKVTCEVTYSGCWPADTGQLQLDQESNRFIINQNFSVDSMSLKFL